MIKWLGAILIVGGCGGFGCSLAAGVRREMRLLKALLSVLTHMECQLRYQLTPLPELCRSVPARGLLGKVMGSLARCLEEAMAPDVRTCMAWAIRKSGDVPPKVRRLLLELGDTLGRFDLAGQLTSLEAIRADCQRQLEALSNDQDLRLRSYTTLGLCAGAAAVILFL